MVERVKETCLELYRFALREFEILQDGDVKVVGFRETLSRLTLEPYLPTQKRLKIRLRMSSVVVAPVISSRARKAL